MSRPSAAFLGATVFGTGAAIMTIEMAASRLIAPFYGTSLPIWTALIGTLLIFLSLGYWLGGKLADKQPEPKPLYLLIGIAGVSTMLLPYVGHWILGFSVKAIDGHTGSYSAAALIIPLTATIMLLSIPVTALGCVSPFAVRLAARDVTGVGSTAGRLYALSNVGSILGTFLPVFLLIPLLGTRSTFLVAGAWLILISATGLARFRWLGIALFLTLPAFFLDSTVKPVKGLVEEDESLYHHIEVSKYVRCKKNGGDGVKLRLNEGYSMHSSYCPGHLWLNQFWDWFSIAPIIGNMEGGPKNMLVIGLAAGTVAQQYKSLYPNMEISGVEIDGDIIRVGRKHFALDQFVPPENQYVQDGRTFLYRTNERYDVIIIDAFRQPYIPFHLTTKEFFEEIKEHLTDRGVVAMNVNKVRPGINELSQRIRATMDAVFEHTLTWSSDMHNDLLTGSRVACTPEAIVERLSSSEHKELRNLVRSMNKLSDNPRNKRYRDQIGFNVVKSIGPPLTDDRAPVEMVWDGMLLGMIDPD